MDINITQNSQELGRVAGGAAASLIREAINTKGSANIILATRTSQFATLNQLVVEPGIDWGKVVMFHLDEYIGLPVTASPALENIYRKGFYQRCLS
jgi:glucosamine-6-phosphate deaminase